MKIQQAKKEDLKEIAKLGEKFEEFQDSLIGKNNKALIKLEERKGNVVKVIEEDLTKSLRKRNFKILVAKDNKKIIRYFTYSIRSCPGYSKLGEYGRLNYAYIEPEYRKKGIFKLFIKEAYDWFKKNNISVVTLQTRKENKKAFEIYKKMGFKECSMEMAAELR